MDNKLAFEEKVRQFEKAFKEGKVKTTFKVTEDMSLVEIQYQIFQDGHINENFKQI